MLRQKIAKSEAYSFEKCLGLHLGILELKPIHEEFPFSMGDVIHSSRDLMIRKLFTPQKRFLLEQYSASFEEVVGLSVVQGHLMRIKFGEPKGVAGIERYLFSL